MMCIRQDIGKLEEKYIILDDNQHTDDSIGISEIDLSDILMKFKGSGVVEVDGEEPGDYNIYKYKDGKEQKGKMVFE